MTKTYRDLAFHYANSHSGSCCANDFPGLQESFLAGYEAAKAVVEAELKLVQARREETPGLGAVCYALNNILEKMG